MFRTLFKGLARRYRDPAAANDTAVALRTRSFGTAATLGEPTSIFTSAYY